MSYIERAWQNSIDSLTKLQPYLKAQAVTSLNVEPASAAIRLGTMRNAHAILIMEDGHGSSAEC